MFLARLPTVWLGLLLVALIGRWAAEMAAGGMWLRTSNGRATVRDAAGLLALLIAAFDPNLLAHMRLATTDFGLTAAACFAGYGLWRMVRWPSRRSAVLAGLGLGLMLNTKFTAFLFLPLFGLVGLAALVGQWRHYAGTRVRGLLVPFLLVYPAVGFLVLWASNGFDIGVLPAELPSFPQLAGWRVPLAHFLEQLLDIGRRLQVATPSFLLGQYSTTGWWYYFPVAFLLKTPLPTLLLLVWACAQTAVWLWRQRGQTSSAVLDVLALLIPSLGFFAIALTTEINLGYRHILPVLPFFFVFIGVAFGPGVAQLLPSIRRLSASSIRTAWTGWAVVVLVGGLAAVSLWVYPHFLAYFNLLAGGPDRGWRALVDSNLDWGQDLGVLGSWMGERGIEEVWLSYFGEARPEYYGIRYVGLDSFPPRLMNPQARPFYPTQPAPGWYAISATNLQGVHFADHDQFAYFRDREPADKLGYSIFLYEVPATGEAANLLLSGLQPDQLAEADYAALSTNDVSLRWFDGSQALLLPQDGRPTWLFVAEDTPLAQEWQGLLAAALPLDVVGSGYAAYRLAGYPSLPRESSQAFTLGESQISFHGDADVQRSGETLRLVTAWTQDDIARPVKIFIHLLDDSGGIVAQWDGLGAQWEGWRTEDALFQRHEISLPAGTEPGDYRIVAGLYDPDTLERWRLPSGADSVELAQITVP